MGERGWRPATGVYQHHRSWALACRYCRLRIDVCLCAIKTNIADSLNVVIHVERRPGRRYISEVLVINRYDPDADLFDYGAVFLAKQDHP